MYTLEIIATFLNIKSSKIRINNTNLNYIEGFHIIKKAWEVVNEILPTSVECDDVRKKLEAFFVGHIRPQK